MLLPSFDTTVFPESTTVPFSFTIAVVVWSFTNVMATVIAGFSVACSLQSHAIMPVWLTLFPAVSLPVMTRFHCSPTGVHVNVPSLRVSPGANFDFETSTFHVPANGLSAARSVVDNKQKKVRTWLALRVFLFMLSLRTVVLHNPQAILKRNARVVERNWMFIDGFGVFRKCSSNVLKTLDKLVKGAGAAKHLVRVLH